MRRLPNIAETALGSPVRNLASILIFMAVVAVVATLAYMRAGWSFADASYMVVLTVYSVGYGEVHPIDTPYLHAVTMATMVLGCTGMILLTSALIQVFTALQLRALFGADRMKRKIDHLSDHVIICGFGRIGVMLAQELRTADRPFVIVERSPAKVAEAEAAGYICLTGEATDETVLIDAGIHRAKVLATVLPDDAANVFITLRAQPQPGGRDHRARRGADHRGQTAPCRRRQGRAADPYRRRADQGWAQYLLSLGFGGE
jgi:voltage-gated potassium channel